MNKWYEKNQGIIWVVTITVGIMAYAYTTFATVEYVDKKHTDVSAVLSEMKDDLKDVRNKVYELNGEIPRVK